MRRPLGEHRDHDWWVHEHAGELELLDLWEFPLRDGREEDFGRFLGVLDPEALRREASWIVRGLFALRVAIGRVLRWDGAEKAFEEIHRDRCEWVVATENVTVRAWVQFGWVRRLDGSWTARLAVLARPKGRRGRLYLWSIAPFRHHLVYPELVRVVTRLWERSVAMGCRPASDPGRHGSSWSERVPGKRGRP